MFENPQKELMSSAHDSGINPTLSTKVNKHISPNVKLFLRDDAGVLVIFTLKVLYRPRSYMFASLCTGSISGSVLSYIISPVCSAHYWHLLKLFSFHTFLLNLNCTFVFLESSGSRSFYKFGSCVITFASATSPNETNVSTRMRCHLF